MDWIPARTISVTYAPSNMARQMTPEITFEMSFGGPNRTSSHASVSGEA